MKLHREERDYYIVTIAVDPPLAGTWEASFDAGETWIGGTPTGDSWAWLVAGPDFVATEVGMTDEGTQLTSSVRPLVRLKDDPVLDVQYGPSISVWA